MSAESKVAGMWRKDAPKKDGWYYIKGGYGSEFCSSSYHDKNGWHFQGIINQPKPDEWLDESPEAIVEATYEDERLRLAKLIDSRGDEIERLTAENEQLKKQENSERLQRQRDELLGHLKMALEFFDEIKMYTDVDTDEKNEWEKAIAAIEGEGK